MDDLVDKTLRQEYNVVMEAARRHLSPIHKYGNFTLQKAFHQCSYECIDKSRRTEERISCLQNCAIPELRYNSEIADFEEKLNRSLLYCRDKFDAAKLQNNPDFLIDLVICADESAQDTIKMLPHLANTLKASLGLTSDKDKSAEDTIKLLPHLANMLKASLGLNRNKYGTQAAAYEQIAQKEGQKIHEANEAVEKHLSPLRDYVANDLQKAFHKCAYECFDKTRRAGEINRCYVNCNDLLFNANQIYNSEVAKFHTKVLRSMLVCKDRYEAARIQKKTGALNDALTCVDESVQEYIKMLPHIADTMKASLGISGDNRDASEIKGRD